MNNLRRRFDFIDTNNLKSQPHTKTSRRKTEQKAALTYLWVSGQCLGTTASTGKSQMITDTTLFITIRNN